MTNAATTRRSFKAYKHSSAGRFTDLDSNHVVRIASHPSFRDPRQHLSVPARVQMPRSSGAVHNGAVRRPPSSHSPRVRNRRIFVAVLVAVSVLAVLLPAREAFGGKTLVSSERPSAEVRNLVASVVVQPGDTLWSIARRLEPHRDPRDVVDELVDARGRANVDVGETITWSK